MVLLGLASHRQEGSAATSGGTLPRPAWLGFSTVSPNLVYRVFKMTLLRERCDASCHLLADNTELQCCCTGTSASQLSQLERLRLDACWGSKKKERDLVLK